jgi:hypothetical protein
MNNEKFVYLLVKFSRGTEKCDMDDEEQPHYYMSWESGISKIKVPAADLKAQIDKHCDGDWDSTSEVLMVVDDHDEILVDYTAPRHYIDTLAMFKNITQDEREAFMDRQRGEVKDWDWKRNREIETVMIAARPQVHQNEESHYHDTIESQRSNDWEAN